MKKKYIMLINFMIVISVFAFLPWLGYFYVICAVIDLGRNKTLTLQDVTTYLFGHDFIVWVLSPLNMWADLLAWGRPKYLELNELPKQCQDEIDTLINSFDKDHLIKAAQEKMQNEKKGMIFFKWYGKNIDNFINIDTFHVNYKYIKTVGLSIFNKHSSTKRHFGPYRYTHRVLYNLSPIKHEGVYLEVDGHKHYWHENPLFIFDDTYVHQSFNESDTIRYVLFIDIVRSTRFFHGYFEWVISLARVLMSGLKGKFYGPWTFLK